MQMAEKTLVQMYRGGIFDHIGGGFCRYSTDERWLVPHFEKMLYDNAWLLAAYAQAYSLTGNSFYRQVGEQIFEYIEQELTDPEGGFWCGQQRKRGPFLFIFAGRSLSGTGRNRRPSVLQPV